MGPIPLRAIPKSRILLTRMATDATGPKWRKFEKLVYEIQKELVPDAEVKLNDHIEGADSKALRQVDVSIRKNVGQYRLLVVIDCKDHAEPLDVNTVAQFAGLLRDVRANKGALVSASGFTKAALEYAKTHGIDTFRLVDTEGVEWRSYLSIPVLLEGTRLKAWSLTFRDFEFIPAPKGQATDFRSLRVYGHDGKCVGTVHDIIADRWNSGVIPHEPGEHDFVIGDNLLCEFAGERFRTTLGFRVLVERRFFFGSLPVHLRGLRDEQTGGIHTRQLRTDFIEPYAIEQGKVEGWQQIESAEQLAVRPVLQMGYSDHLPSLDKWEEQKA